MKKTKAKENLTKDIGTVVLSIILAIVLAQTGTFKDFLLASQEREIFGNFLAGMFFTSLFTVAPAIVVLAELADTESLWRVAVIGGLGAVLGDYIIFRFVKDQLTQHLRDYFREMKGKRRLPFRWGMWRWLMFMGGALVVASPLPDELGLAMMGLTKMKTTYFILLSFTLNALGIFLVGLIGREV